MVEENRIGFYLNGKKSFYTYFQINPDPNNLMHSERPVELAIARSYLVPAQHAGAYILEVGNTLKQYMPGYQVVVDKFDQSGGVYAVDIMDFKPPQKFDLVISISTVEHIGWDEDCENRLPEALRDTGKSLRAIEHMKSLRKPGGSLVVTWPFGFHPTLDRMVLDGTVTMDTKLFMQRTSIDTWEECDAATASKRGMFDPYPWGNSLFIGVDHAN
jgi:SAM-dependent methyltransferase